MFASSLAAGVILTEFAMDALDGKTVRLPFDMVPKATWDLGIVSVSSMQLLMLGTTTVVFLALTYVVESTEFGREMRTVAFDREVASMLGIRVWRVSALVFFLSGFLAGVGSTLIGLAFNSVHANLGNTYLLMAIAVLVVGGLGSVKGGFIGGLLIGLATAYTTGYFTSSYSEVVVYGLLLTFLIVRPTGLFRTSDVAGRV
jgi:branched-chain amino acid transport system permease protein